MHSIISNNIERIRQLCQKYKVNNLYVFGSVVSNELSESSDIDLLIEFYDMGYADYADYYLEIAEEFEELFNKPVDLITTKSLNNPILIESINQTKKQIYGKVG